MKELTYYKKKLEDEKELLITELKSLGRIVDPITGDWEAVPDDGVMESDENDLADRYEDYEQKSEILNTLEKKLKDVDDALNKIKNGKYGLCEISGKEIEEERLEANPSARTCVEHMND